MGKLDAFVTNRLILRELQVDDFEPVHRIKSHPDAVRYLTWGPNTEQQTKTSLLKQIGFQDHNPRNMYVLAVVIKETTELIGNALIMIRDEHFRVAEIGYFLHPNTWNNGYGKEVVQSLMSIGFLQLHLHRIYATCDVENKASIKVLEVSGFRREGHFIKDLYVKGEWRDNFLYAQLRSEYNGG